ncbi:hypothetical protein GIB67_038064 [Kingdonia uniflora]|uniref:Uncharacterized protein n=1 Tax=Kingdonia uniflora TaxID=39325 RepID=A0A7J7LKU1_9MAGN|nr:hypothetical protein GIB67_038064 [Kingdonia uniflora]
MDSLDSREEDAPLIVNDSKGESKGDLPKNNTRDVHILSIAFLLIFLAYGAAQNLQRGELGDNVVRDIVCVVYGVFVSGIEYGEDARVEERVGSWDYWVLVLHSCEYYTVVAQEVDGIRNSAVKKGGHELSKLLQLEGKTKDLLDCGLDGDIGSRSGIVVSVAHIGLVLLLGKETKRGKEFFFLKKENLCVFLAIVSREAETRKEVKLGKEASEGERKGIRSEQKETAKKKRLER